MKTTRIKHKSQAALSTFCWGIYMLLNGVGMLVYPTGTITMMGLDPANELSIRMLGLLSLVLGFYYVQMGRNEYSPFYTWKLIGHAGGILIMTFLYILSLAPATIFIICLMDALAAIWTAWGQHHDRKKALLPAVA